MRTGTIFAMIEELWPCRATDKGKQLSMQEQPMQGTNLSLWQKHLLTRQGWIPHLHLLTTYSMRTSPHNLIVWLSYNIVNHFLSYRKPLCHPLLSYLKDSTIHHDRDWPMGAPTYC